MKNSIIILNYHIVLAVVLMTQALFAIKLTYIIDEGLRFYFKCYEISN